MNPVILIPARMASTRLPNKPMAMIAGAPMIVHVWRRAVESKAGQVVVACDGEEIRHAIERAGGTAIVTDPAFPSGSDRIHDALRRIDPGKNFDCVINLQGDMPTLDPKLVAQVLAPLENPQADIATLAAEIRDEEEKHDPAVVKAIIAHHPAQKPSSIGRALYFTRVTAPYGDGPYYHHIGIYAYRRDALERFVALPPSVLEQREKLEQLRALEAGMRIDIAVVDAVPLGVDTEQTLEKARKILCHQAM